MPCQHFYEPTEEVCSAFVVGNRPRSVGNVGFIEVFVELFLPAVVFMTIKGTEHSNVTGQNPRTAPGFDFSGDSVQRAAHFSGTVGNEDHGDHCTVVVVKMTHFCDGNFAACPQPLPDLCNRASSVFE